MTLSGLTRPTAGGGQAAARPGGAVGAGAGLPDSRVDTPLTLPSPALPEPVPRSQPHGVRAIACGGRLHIYYLHRLGHRWDAGPLRPKGTSRALPCPPVTAAARPSPSTPCPVSLRLCGWRGLASGLTAQSLDGEEASERANEQELRGRAGATGLPCAQGWLPTCGVLERTWRPLPGCEWTGQSDDRGPAGRVQEAPSGCPSPVGDAARWGTPPRDPHATLSGGSSLAKDVHISPVGTTAALRCRWPYREQAAEPARRPPAPRPAGPARLAAHVWGHAQRPSSVTSGLRDAGQVVTPLGLSVLSCVPLSGEQSEPGGHWGRRRHTACTQGTWSQVAHSALLCTSPGPWWEGWHSGVLRAQSHLRTVATAGGTARGQACPWGRLWPL